MAGEADKMDKETIAVLRQIEHVDDPRDALVALKERIRHFEQAGKSVPPALVRAEHSLLVELAAHSQGR